MAKVESVREWAERQKPTAVGQLEFFRSGGVIFNEKGVDVTNSVIADLQRVVALYEGIIAREQATTSGPTP